MAGAIRAAFDAAYLDGEENEPEKSVIRNVVGGTIQSEVEAIANSVTGAAEGYIIGTTWIALAATAGTRVGQPGRVPNTDTGTHTDPVVGGTVPNGGEYRWSSSPAGWQRYGDVIDAALVADVSATADEVDAANTFTLSGNSQAGYDTILADDDNKALLYFDFSTQKIDGSIAGIDEMSAGLAFDFYLDVEDGDPLPIIVNEKGEVVSSTEQASTTTRVSEPTAVGYVSGTTLRAIGATAGDREINSDADKDWIAASSVYGGIQAVYSDDDSVKHMVRVSVKSAEFYYDGELSIIIGVGQSGAEGRANETASALWTSYPYVQRLMMPQTPANDVWLGMRTSAGVSIALDPDSITGLTTLRGAAVGNYGTTSVESMAYRMCEKAFSECGSYVPMTVIWSAAEGGESIANLMKDPPEAGKYAWSNLVAVLNRINDVAPADLRPVVRWLPMLQGEDDANNANLGQLHDQYRSDIEDEAQAIFGQTEPVRMLTAQMSSFINANNTGVKSVLSHATSVMQPYGSFWCLGPTYNFPFAADFLHQTSVGHGKLGELFEAARRYVERTGMWSPLRMLSASVTGANTITVQLSEAAILDTINVAAVVNAGITVPGRTVTNVAISGTTMTITTSAAAAGATSVESALVGQSSPVRTAENVPRTNIRSVATYGKYRDASDILKWMCHQSISIS